MPARLSRITLERGRVPAPNRTAKTAQLASRPRPAIAGPDKQRMHPPADKPTDKSGNAKERPTANDPADRTVFVRASRFAAFLDDQWLSAVGGLLSCQRVLEVTRQQVETSEHSMPEMTADELRAIGRELNAHVKLHPGKHEARSLAIRCGEFAALLAAPTAPRLIEPGSEGIEDRVLRIVCGAPLSRREVRVAGIFALVWFAVDGHPRHADGLPPCWRVRRPR